MIHKKRMIKRIRIGTRNSPLALWQANFIKNKIEKKFPEINIELVYITTQGDRDQASSLTQVGGQGIFTKTIENSLIANEVDMAVHSLKDLPTEMPQNLTISAVPERGSVFDVFIGLKEADFTRIRQGAVIASGSVRRRAQLLALRPDLKFADLRGNIETRLEKLEQYKYDGIIMAEAALIRLNLNNIKFYRFSFEEMLPAVGQGALAIQTRSNDHIFNPILNYINDIQAGYCVSAERAFLRRLDSGCQFPVAANATIVDNWLTLSGLVSSKNGSHMLKDSIQGRINNSEELGINLAEKLIGQGALEVLAED